MRRFTQLSLILALLIAFALQGGALVRVVRQSEGAQTQPLVSAQICDIDNRGGAPAQEHHDRACALCVFCNAAIAILETGLRAAFQLRGSLLLPELPDQSRDRVFAARAASHAPRAPPAFS